MIRIKTLKLEFFDGVHEVAKFTVTITAELDFTVTAVARTLIGGGGVYSYIQVLPD